MDIFLRKINLELYDREFTPMSSAVTASRRGFVNELAFQLFCEIGLSSAGLSESTTKAIKATQKKILGLDTPDSFGAPNPDPIELEDAAEQLSRLQQFFRAQSNGQTIVMSPAFSGCGIIDSCNGDVSFDDTLFEIKAGDRNFRSIDLRQLLTYTALSYAETKKTFRRVGLFNPRVGVSFSMALDELCFEVSGHAASEMLSEVIRVISSGDLSR